MKQTEYTVATTSWQEHSAAIKHIRTTVFIKEQNVPAELEWDGLDEHCTHFIVRHGSNIIATARLKADGHIGRMSVLKNHRQKGVGSLLLNYILSYTEKKGLAEVYLHAQVPVIAFYQIHGFIIIGENFIDAGIPHRGMYKKIC